MLVLFALAAFAPPQVSAEAAAQTPVSICTAQEGGLNRHTGFRRPDGQVWWHATLAEGGAPFEASREVTAGDRDWYRDRRPLTVRGLTYEFKGVAPLSDWPFRRYNRIMSPIDGVPALAPLGVEDREVWVLLEPVGCRFAVWAREPAGT
ncbi:MAG: hypothetical protein REJ23_09220 [Brevundimonas sp.]|nr:hypothetical protein [Brevundimonas sp.]